MDKSKNKSNIIFVVFGVAIASFFIRLLWLKHNLFFGFEQGRDFLKLTQILDGDFVLIGPKTDIDGVFHGALSYYIPLVPFTLFHGDPYAVLVTYLFAHLLSVVFLYFATKEMFSKRVGIVAIILYSVSYSAIIYSRWLSNPNLIPALSIIYFCSLVYSRKDWRYLFIASMVFGVMVHLMVVVPVAFVIPTLIFLRKEKVKLNLRRLFALLIPLLAILSTYFVFELRNDFIISKSLFNDQTKSGSLLTGGIGFIDQFFNEAIDTTVPIIPRISFIVFTLTFMYCVYLIKKIPNLVNILTFLLSVPMLFLFISDSPLRHFFITASIFVSIMIAVAWDNLRRTKHGLLSWVLLMVVIFGNILAIGNRIPETKANFVHHAQRTYLGDMKQAIDYIYTDAKGTEFTYDYYSVPYWKEDAWIYLFQWYGKSNYGYAPQMNRTNVERSEIFYTIIEPNETDKIHKDNWYGEYKKDSVIIETKNFGMLTVEKRNNRSE